MKKFVSILLTVVMAMGLVACSSNSSTGSSSQQESSNSSSDKKYTVGICQLVQHEALDAATKGFKT